jgi:hypothetical protein
MGLVDLALDFAERTTEHRKAQGFLLGDLSLQRQWQASWRTSSCMRQSSNPEGIALVVGHL